MLFQKSKDPVDRKGLLNLVTGNAAIAFEKASSQDEKRTILQKSIEIGFLIGGTNSPKVMQYMLQHIGKSPELAIDDMYKNLQKSIKINTFNPDQKMVAALKGTTGNLKKEADQLGELLSPGEVARILGVSPKTVANWCDKGLLECVMLGSGHRRISIHALDRYKKMQEGWRKLNSLQAKAWGDKPEISEEDAIEEVLNRRRSSQK